MVPATVRPTARRGPYDGGRRGSRVPHGSASAAGSHGSSHGGGCSAGRCACSRLSLHCQELLELLECAGETGVRQPVTELSWQVRRGSMKRPGYAGCLPGYGQPGTGVKLAARTAARHRRHADRDPYGRPGLVGRAGKLLASRAHGSESPSPPERYSPRCASRSVGRIRPPTIIHTCGQLLWKTYGGA
jgi:hypothetical protein